MRRKISHFLILMVLLIAGRSWSQEVHSFYTGARSLGMGGVKIAVVDDETALASNPAALGKLRDYYGTIFDPEVEVSSNDNNINGASAITSPTDLAQVSASLQKTKNTYYHYKDQVFPSFVVRNFGIGLYYRQVLDMITNTSGNTNNVFFQQDEALLLGYAFRFWDGRIKLGFTGKVIDRVELVNSALAYPGNYNLPGTNATEGAAVGGDVGLILTAPWAMLPTLSVVARDVGSTQFTAGKNIQMTTTGTPSPMTQDYDAAIAIFPISANRIRSSISLEVQSVLASQTALDPIRYYHAGWELNVHDAFFLRAGMNGHWPTAGFEVATQNFQFQFTYYGEDIGQGVSITQDTRYLAKLAFRF